MDLRKWDRQLEDGLPDCRTKERKIVMRGRVLMEVVYCAQCHQARGLVTADWTPHVFFICDECFGRTAGKAPEGTIQIPDEMVGRCRSQP